MILAENNVSSFIDKIINWIFSSWDEVLCVRSYGVTVGVV